MTRNSPCAKYFSTTVFSIAKPTSINTRGNNITPDQYRILIHKLTLTIKEKKEQERVEFVS